MWARTAAGVSASAPTVASPSSSSGRVALMSVRHRRAQSAPEPLASSGVRIVGGRVDQQEGVFVLLLAFLDRTTFARGDRVRASHGGGPQPVPQR
jgi:hypothetical protein